MAVISFANAKGGAGKTTAALLLATELAHRGETVVVLDCDPLEFAGGWYKMSGAVERISVRTGITSSNLAAHLRTLHGEPCHVIIDLSGARDMLIALAAGLSDYVLVPIQGSAMDARGATHVLDLIRYVESNTRKTINHAVLLTRVSACVTTRAMRSVKDLLARRDIALLDTPIVERSAYRDMFEHGGTLYTIDPGGLTNVEKARINMQAFAFEVQQAMRLLGRSASRGPFAQMCYQASPGAGAVSTSGAALAGNKAFRPGAIPAV